MRTTVILSGGMDSAVLLYKLLGEGDIVNTVSVDYGQRHRRELICAERLSARVGVHHDVIDMTSLGRLLKGSSQSDPTVDVPFGRYDEPSMKQTVVPNRNMVLLAAAGAVAIANRADRLAYGAHGGDHAIYPDCRPEFVYALAKAFQLCDWHPVHLVAPLSAMHKGEIAVLGGRLRVPFQVTWTCYVGGDEPCGKCGACVERAEAFEFAHLKDPLIGGYYNAW